ncbi:hypothetical protein KW803_00580 [Candidatus Saccharibacteria bacterium]|nr:hypothetical protein [Candidatus Saccharibacteria bacterium]
MTVVKKDIKRLCLILAASVLCILSFNLHTAIAKADNIIQGYDSAESLQPGLLVALDKNSSRTVKVLPGADSDHLFGVVVDPTDAPFTLNAESSKVFVATSGSFQALISTTAGIIKPGDFVTISNLSGIAQKANSGQTRILGQAVSGFDGTSNVITTDGNAKIGRIFVQINPQNNPLANNAVLVPSFLKKASNAVAGKSVPAIRIYASLGVFVFAAIVAILVLWSGVRGSLIALGRNPLSRKAIFSGMYKVVFTGIGIFILGLAGVYLLLRV